MPSCLAGAFAGATAAVAAAEKAVAFEERVWGGMREAEGKCDPTPSNRRVGDSEAHQVGADVSHLFAGAPSPTTLRFCHRRCLSG